jgi:hypothetical protein
MNVGQHVRLKNTDFSVAMTVTIAVLGYLRPCSLADR